MKYMMLVKQVLFKYTKPGHFSAKTKKRQEENRSDRMTCMTLFRSRTETGSRDLKVFNHLLDNSFCKCATAVFRVSELPVHAIQCLLN